MNVLCSIGTGSKALEAWPPSKNVSYLTVPDFPASWLVRTVSIRLKSVKNIEKITKSMKMVSAAKYARAERQLKPARTYGVAAQGTRERERERERLRLSCEVFM